MTTDTTRRCSLCRSLMTVTARGAIICPHCDRNQPTRLTPAQSDFIARLFRPREDV